MLRRRSGSYSLQWLGRLATLLCFVIQDTAIIINYYRRPLASSLVPPVSEGDDPWYRETWVVNDFDTGNVIFAIGGLAAGLVSLAMVACNWSWTYSTLGLQPGEHSQFEDGDWHTVMQLNPPPPCWPEVALAVVFLLAASCFFLKGILVATIYFLWLFLARGIDFNASTIWSFEVGAILLVVLGFVAVQTVFDLFGPRRWRSRG